MEGVFLPHDALRQENILKGDAGKLGEYDIISFLPDKVDRFLYEYHDNIFQRLDLPPIPEDRSKFDAHAALKPEQVVHNIYLNYLNYLNYLDIYYYLY